MTWIVGGPGFSVPFLAGDIRITFTWPHKEETYDCLRKIYPIARNVLAGFAGSVDIGLRLVELAAQHLDVSKNADLPGEIVRWFPAFAKKHFSEAPAVQQAGGCKILMVGMHPTLQQDMIPTPRTDAVRFEAPDFEPRTTTNAAEVWGIGSGEDVDVLRAAALAAIRSNGFYRTDEFQFAGGPINADGDLQLQLSSGFRGPAAKMAHALHRALTANPTPGVGEWFVYGTVSLTEPPFIEPPIYQSITRAGVQSVKTPLPFAIGSAAFQKFRVANGLATAVAVG